MNLNGSFLLSPPGTTCAWSSSSTYCLYWWWAVRTWWWASPCGPARSRETPLTATRSSWSPSARSRPPGCRCGEMGDCFASLRLLFLSLCFLCSVFFLCYAFPACHHKLISPERVDNPNQITIQSSYLQSLRSIIAFCKLLVFFSDKFCNMAIDWVCCFECF